VISSVGKCSCDVHVTIMWRQSILRFWSCVWKSRACLCGIIAFGLGISTRHTALILLFGMHRHSSRYITCAVTDTTLVTYAQCSRDDANFTLNDCPDDHMIDIQSAEVGFYRNNKTCYPRKTAYCVRSINHPSIEICNGQRSCSFSDEVLSYSGNESCRNRSAGNFVWITYYCRGK